jgi:hypothetical protein
VGTCGCVYMRCDEKFHISHVYRGMEKEVQRRAEKEVQRRADDSSRVEKGGGKGKCQTTDCGSSRTKGVGHCSILIPTTFNAQRWQKQKQTI